MSQKMKPGQVWSSGVEDRRESVLHWPTPKYGVAERSENENTRKELLTLIPQTIGVGEFYLSSIKFRSR